MFLLLAACSRSVVVAAMGRTPVRRRSSCHRQLSTLGWLARCAPGGRARPIFTGYGSRSPALHIIFLLLGQCFAAVELSAGRVEVRPARRRARSLPLFLAASLPRSREHHAPRSDRGASASWSVPRARHYESPRCAGGCRPCFRGSWSRWPPVRSSVVRSSRPSTGCGGSPRPRLLCVSPPPAIVSNPPWLGFTRFTCGGSRLSPQLRSQLIRYRAPRTRCLLLGHALGTATTSPSVIGAAGGGSAGRSTDRRPSLPTALASLRRPRSRAGARASRTLAVARASDVRDRALDQREGLVESPLFLAKCLRGRRELTTGVRPRPRRRGVPRASLPGWFRLLGGAPASSPTPSAAAYPY